MLLQQGEHGVVPYNLEHAFLKIHEIYISSSLVEDDPKVLFSIATTPSCRGGCYSIL